MSVAKGVVELDLCEVGGSQTLRQFWHHYVWPSSIQDRLRMFGSGGGVKMIWQKLVKFYRCCGVVDDI